MLQPTLSTPRAATAELLRGLAESATLAPSVWNTQPWRFRLGDGALELLADRTRALPVTDPHDRELIVSCGAALYTLRLAARNRAREVEVELFPRAGEPDLLARVRLGATRRPTDEEWRLFLDVPRRRTHRDPFLDKPVPPEVVFALCEAAESEGAWLEPIREPQRREAIAGLVAEADEALWQSDSWRRERAMWMHPRRKGDGLPVAAVTAPLAHALVGAVDLGHSRGKRDRDLAAHAPLLAALGTRTDTPRDWLAAGQALQRVLLMACSMELQASYLNQPIELSALRPRLDALVARSGTAQLLLRFGQPARELPATPRRPVSEVLERG